MAYNSACGPWFCCVRNFRVRFCVTHVRRCHARLVTTRSRERLLPARAAIGPKPALVALGAWLVLLGLLGLSHRLPQTTLAAPDNG